MKIYEPDWNAKEMKESDDVIIPEDKHYFRVNDVEYKEFSVITDLMDIAAKARFELDHPTGLHATCLSLIEKSAHEAQAKLLDSEAPKFPQIELNEGECKHEKCTPQYDEKQMEIDASTMSMTVFREKYPRFDGNCPDCGVHLISYASYDHYLMGSW